MVTMPTIDTIRTGHRIEKPVSKKLRILSGLSVKQLQEILGLGTPQAIYKWQRGASMPTVDNLVILAKIFNTTIDDIIIKKEE